MQSGDEWMFFDAHASLLPLYGALRTALEASLPAVRKKVQKTQITFSAGHVFACVSFLRVPKRTAPAAPYFVLTLGLPAPMDSPRAAVQTQPYPGRWTVHIPLSAPDEIDAQLLTWVRQAYDFAGSKFRRRIQ